MKDSEMNSNSTNICIKCQRPREEGGGCYTFCNGKNFLPIPEENPKHPGCRRRKLGRRYLLLIIIYTMKCTESRELRDLSMNQLNAKLSELYKELHRSQE